MKRLTKSLWIILSNQVMIFWKETLLLIFVFGALSTTKFHYIGERAYMCSNGDHRNDPQEHTRLDSFHQLIGVFNQLIGRIRCTLDWSEQKPAATQAFMEQFGHDP